MKVRASAISSIKRYMCPYDVHIGSFMPPWTGPRFFIIFYFMTHELYYTAGLQVHVSSDSRPPDRGLTRGPWWTGLYATDMATEPSPEIPLKHARSTARQVSARKRDFKTHVVRQPTPTSERSHAAPPGQNDRTQPPTHSSTERGTPPTHSPGSFHTRGSFHTSTAPSWRISVYSPLLSSRASARPNS